MAKKSIIVRYTGRYPNLCSGEWLIYINGVKHQTPFMYGEDAETWGFYKPWYVKTTRWDFTFYDGLTAHEWIYQHAKWLKTLHVGKGRWKEVYDKFQEKDWRKGECGGCD